MLLASEQGPVLAGIDLDEPEGGSDEAVDRLDGAHHHLVWSEVSAVQVRTPRHALLAAPPHAHWVPAGLPYEVECSAPRWTARFVASSCPASWERVAQPPLSDIVGPVLAHLHRYPHRSWAPQLASAVVEHLQEAFVANAMPVRFPTDPRAREVAEAVAADPSLTWELVDWEPLVGASVRTLRRLFVEQTGMSFTKWRLRIRAHAATRLLRDGVPVAEVATRCGYGSAHAFTRALRAELGVTPSELAAVPSAATGERFDAWPPARGSWPRQPATPHDTPLIPLVESILGGQMSGWRSRGALLVGAGLLLMAACGDSDSEGADATTATTAEATTPTTSTSSDTDAETAPGAEMVSFTDGVGRTVEVPARPQRIVSIGVYQGDALLAVGSPVVGIGERGSAEDALVAHYPGGEEIPKIGSVWDPDVEAILALEPDLIVGDAWLGEVSLAPEIVAQIESIAPTVFLDSSRPVDEHMELVGRLTGLSESVAEERELTEVAVNELAAALPEGLSASIVEYWDPNVFVYTTTEPILGMHVLNEVGVSGPPQFVDASEPTSALSSERLLETSADLYFYFDHAPPTELPLYVELPAVESEQAYEIPASINGYSYAAMRRFVNYYRPILSAADPGVVDESAS